MNVINFSGGRTSAYMAKRLIDEGIDRDEALFIFENTGKEMPETLDFIKECDERWGLNMIWLEYRPGRTFEQVDYDTASRNGEPFDMLLQENNALPNTMMRFCTREMKVSTLKRFMHSIGVHEWDHYVGIRYDEPRRWAKTSALPQYMTVMHPLVKWKVTEPMVLGWWAEQDFDLKLNKPYGNCDACFLKGKGKLMIIAKERPDLFEWWVKHEERTGNTFKKEISYQKLLDLAESQMGLFDDDPSFSCFCNVD